MAYFCMKSRTQVLLCLVVRRVENWKLVAWMWLVFVNATYKNGLQPSSVKKEESKESEKES